MEAATRERPVVYITRRVPREAAEMLEAACECRWWESDEQQVPREALQDGLVDADGALIMLTDRIDRDLLAGAPRLKVIATMEVGYDNIDLQACEERGVMVCNTPDVLTETTADLVWALMMATARRLVEAQKLVESDSWRSWSPMMLAGQDVHGTTLGLIGGGRIAQAVAKRARGFDMEVLYHSRSRRPEFEEREGARFVALDALLESADFVVPMVALTPQTRHLLGEAELRLMKRSAILVNASRGPVVDERALQRALEEGWIWAAGLDVWDTEPVRADHPLLAFDRLVGLPHIGSASIATRKRMATLAAQNLIAGLSGAVPPNLVRPQGVA